jgi:hypothetical protein
MFINYLRTKILRTYPGTTANYNVSYHDMSREVASKTPVGIEF